jgi:phasin
MAMSGEQFQIPHEMRALAEKSVEQARQAFDGFMTAAHRTVSTMEGQAEAARRGAKDVSERAIDFAEQNIATSFEFAQKLVRAKDVKEMLELQGTYVKTQMQALAEQARELGESGSKAATEPLKSSPQT